MTQNTPERGSSELQDWEVTSPPGRDLRPAEPLDRQKGDGRTPGSPVRGAPSRAQ